jgi:hypothetical protein
LELQHRFSSSIVFSSIRNLQIRTVYAGEICIHLQPFAQENTISIFCARFSSNGHLTERFMISDSASDTAIENGAAPLSLKGCLDYAGLSSLPCAPLN